MPQPQERVTVHLRVAGTQRMPQLMAHIRAIEAAGFDGVGILDSQLLARDAYVVLGQAAACTERLALFPAVTNPFTRHASVLASAIQTVEDMAPGRVKLVVGTGYSSAMMIGRKPATLATMRSCITTLKGALRGESVDWGGASGKLGFATGRPIPILMAASGPKAAELAGEVADGALLQVGFNKGIIETALRHLALGAQRSGRRLADLEVIWVVRTVIAPTLHDARRTARPVAVHWALEHAGYWLAASGIDMPAFDIPQAVRDIYPDLSHAQDWEQAIAATSFVSDDLAGQLCDAIGLIGTPDHCAARIMEMHKLGVRNLYLSPFQTYATPDDEIAAFRDVIFARLQAAGLR